jgi:hypothetical protein
MAPEKSPYNTYIGPNPIRPMLTPAQIAERRMGRIRKKLGIKVSKPHLECLERGSPVQSHGCVLRSPHPQKSQYQIDEASKLSYQEAFSPEALKSWLEESDRLRVKLDAALTAEVEREEISFPLLEEAQSAAQAVKDQMKEYELPKYVHEPAAKPGGAAAAAAAAGPDGSGTTNLGSSLVKPGQSLRPEGQMAKSSPGRGGTGRGMSTSVSGRLSTPPLAGGRPHSPSPLTGLDGRPASPSPIGEGQRPSRPSSAFFPGDGFRPASPSGRAGTTAATGLDTSNSPPQSAPGARRSPPPSPIGGRAGSPGGRSRRKRGEEGGGDARPNSRARLDHFLEKLEASNVLSREDMNSFYSALPLPVSLEMDEQVKEVLEKHLGAGPWQDIVGSTLARPLDAELVHMDERARLELATAAPELAPAKDGEGRPASAHMVVQDSITSLFDVQEGLPQVTYLRRLAAEHRAEGREKEAVECLRQAAGLLEQKEVVMAPQTRVFPYANEVFGAARRIQRMLRRRRERLAKAVTVITSHYRGYLARRVKLMRNSKKVFASKVIQRRYRYHLKVLNRCALFIERVSSTCGQEWLWMVPYPCSMTPWFL